MRKGCWSCCIKHLGEAAIFQTELLAYPNFAVYAIGCLSHAAMEVEAFHPGLAKLIREWRLAAEADWLISIPYEGLYEYILTCEACEVNGDEFIDIPDELKVPAPPSTTLTTLGPAEPAEVKDDPTPVNTERVTEGKVEPYDILLVDGKWLTIPPTGCGVGMPVDSYSEVRRGLPTPTPPPYKTPAIPDGWYLVYGGAIKAGDCHCHLYDAVWSPEIAESNEVIGRPINTFDFVIRPFPLDWPKSTVPYKVEPKPPELPVPEGYELITSGRVKVGDFVQYNDPDCWGMRFEQGDVQSNEVGLAVADPELHSVVRKIPDPLAPRTEADWQATLSETFAPEPQDDVVLVGFETIPGYEGMNRAQDGFEPKAKAGGPLEPMAMATPGVVSQAGPIPEGWYKVEEGVVQIGDKVQSTVTETLWYEISENNFSVNKPVNIFRCVLRRN